MSLPLARWFYEIEPIPLADAVVLGVVDRLEEAARSHALLLKARRASSKPAGSDDPG